MPRRRWLPILVLLLAGLAAVVAIRRPDRMLGQGLRVGAAVVAQTLCSEVFVAGLDPARVEAEELAPQAGLLRRLRVDVDRRHRQVTASWGGHFASVAGVSGMRPDLGCGLASAPAAGAGAALSAMAEAEVPPERPIVAPVTEGLRLALDRAFAEPHPRRPRHVRAIVIYRDGRLVAERYAAGIGPETRLLGYSLSKSVINAMIGVLVRAGRLQVAERAPIPAWASPRDPRHAITVEQLMRMTSGLALEESDSGFDPVSRMLFLEPDMAAFASRAPLKAAPGTAWEYTSGNTLLLSSIIRDAVGGHAADVLAWARRELFTPLGMHHVTIEFDAAGTPIGSTRVLASARDWARLGQLYLDDGECAGRRILPPGWVRFSTTPTLASDYGAGFWVNAGAAPHARGRVRAGMPADSFFGSGLFGQRLVVIPSQRLVIARLGATVDPPDFDIAGLERLVTDVIGATGGRAGMADPGAGGCPLRSL
ncbi:MAG TPA: serine hydrolase [Thermoanaerobaculia bacterium]|nr:serine hydrolase [Thermoanaerobaculia bacterium]